MMGGIDWAGIGVVAETIGIIDIEWLINQLLVIRNFQNAKQERN